MKKKIDIKKIKEKSKESIAKNLQKAQEISEEKLQEAHELFLRSRILVGVCIAIVLAILNFIDSYALNSIFGGFIIFISLKECFALLKTKSYYLEYYGAILFLICAFFTLSMGMLVKILLLNLLMLASFFAYKNILNLKPLCCFIYPFIPLCLMFGIYVNFGLEYLIWVILIVASSDIGAYFGGKRFGKRLFGDRKFSETSPNKTLEGVLFGLIFAVILGMIYNYIFLKIDFYFAIGLNLLVAIFGIFGDLFESLIKRVAGVKDSGTILASHGGILDRLDGHLFGASILAILLW